MADTRSKREKLEAMANQSASPREAEVAREKLHLLFKRRGGSSPFTVVDTPSNQAAWDRAMHSHPGEEPHRKGEPHHMKPHEYAAYGGSDAMGCRVCGRSKDNPYAHHTNVPHRGRQIG